MSGQPGSVPGGQGIGFAVLGLALVAFGVRASADQRWVKVVEVEDRALAVATELFNPAEVFEAVPALVDQEERPRNYLDTILAWRSDRQRPTVARLSLTPQKREFFSLYNEAAGNVVAIADRLVELLDRFPDDADDLERKVKHLEHEGDRLTRDLVDLLNRTFVTPFDRDDMYRLAGALDDVCDHIDEAASRVVSYRVKEIRLQAKEQAQTIRRSAGKLADAVAVLEGFQDSRAHLAELRELENVADRILQDSVSTLFMSRADDPLEVIRWKDIHESLEAAMNACEHAANVLEAIVVKNR